MVSPPALHLPRPRLRGVLHAGMIPVAVLACALLVVQAAPGARPAAAVTGGTTIALFLGSTLYHLPSWSDRVRAVMLKIDNSAILLFMVGQFTPLAVFALDGAWRVASLAVAWTIAVGGVGLLSSGIRIPRAVGTTAYVAIGWLAVIPMYRIAMSLHLTDLGLLVAGGACYTVGAVVFARGRPNPWPEWVGHHEIFHLLVVAGAVCHYPVVWSALATG